MTNDPAIEFLLASRDPSVRYLTLTDILGEGARSRAVAAAKAAIPNGPRFRALLRGQRRDGSFGGHPYQKWAGAHWRLVSLVELAAPSRDPRLRAAAGTVLDWLASDEHRQRITNVEGRVRQHASQEGNALAVCSRLGLAKDKRVRALAASLLAAQWPDGGWNCDVRPEVTHSSFYETVTPMWGLAEFAKATGHEKARSAARRAAEFFLEHRLFRSHTTGNVADEHWLQLHYPLYWHYDVLHGLLLLSRLVPLRDRRTRDALDVVESKRRSDGLWHAEARFWKPAKTAGGGVEAVDWGGRGPSEMITLNALRVLRSAGRI